MGVRRITGNTTVARVVFAFTSLLVLQALVLQFCLALANDDGRFATVPGRFVNVLSFFTIQSNIIVAVTTGMSAWRLDRRSPAFHVLRLTAVIAIGITGVVYHLALRGLHELTPPEAAVDWALHTASPFMAVLGWVVFGPRGWLDTRRVLWCVAFPLLWLAYTLVKGPLVEDRFGRDYYPYPFIDVVEHGYIRVLVNVALVALLFVVLAAGARAADRRLPGVKIA
jgi:hypothetical protein